MPDNDELSQQLSRRERQIMDFLYQHGRATAAEVQANLPDPPSYSAVRAMLRILEEKGHTQHEQDGPRYVYRPSVGRDRASVSALRHLVRTFFDGSASKAMAALLGSSASELGEADLARLEEIIRRAREEKW